MCYNFISYAAILPSKEVLAERKKRWEELFEVIYSTKGQ